MGRTQRTPKARRRPDARALVAAALLAGCRCAPEPAAPAADHYRAFPALVDAAARGDLAAARDVARDVDGDSDADDATAVAAAIGFVADAEDVAEVADAVAAAAAACGACHAERGVAALEARPPWAHADAARWATWGLVWGDPTAPAVSGDAVLDGVVARAAAAEGDGAARARVAAVIEACAACHRGRARP